MSITLSIKSHFYNMYTKRLFVFLFRISTEKSCGYMWIMWISRCISPFYRFFGTFLCGYFVHSFFLFFPDFSCISTFLCTFQNSCLLVLNGCYPVVLQIVKTLSKNKEYRKVKKDCITQSFVFP